MISIWRWHRSLCSRLLRRFMSQSRFVRQIPNRFQSQGRRRSRRANGMNIATIPRGDRINLHRVLDRCLSRGSGRRDLRMKSASNTVRAVNVKVVIMVVGTNVERAEGTLRGTTDATKRGGEMATRAGSIMRIVVTTENSPVPKLQSRALRLGR